MASKKNNPSGFPAWFNWMIPASVGSRFDPVPVGYREAMTYFQQMLWLATHGGSGDGAVPDITAEAVATPNHSANPQVVVTREELPGETHFKFSFEGLMGAPGTDGAPGVPGAKGDPPDVYATASVTPGSGTPGVTVTKSGPVSAPVFDFVFENLQGPKGDTGATGTQGPVGVTPEITLDIEVDDTTGTPTATVVKSGTEERPVFLIDFSGLKGAKGDDGGTGPAGPAGPTPNAEVTVDDTSGTPSATVTLVPGDTPVYQFHFSGLKGPKGDPGSVSGRVLKTENLPDVSGMDELGSLSHFIAGPGQYGFIPKLGVALASDETPTVSWTWVKADDIGGGLPAGGEHGQSLAVKDDGSKGWVNTLDFSDFASDPGFSGDEVGPPWGYQIAKPSNPSPGQMWNLQAKFGQVGNPSLGLQGFYFELVPAEESDVPAPSGTDHAGTVATAVAPGGPVTWELPIPGSDLSGNVGKVPKLTAAGTETAAPTYGWVTPAAFPSTGSASTKFKFLRVKTNNPQELEWAYPISGMNISTNKGKVPVLNSPASSSAEASFVWTEMQHVLKTQTVEIPSGTGVLSTTLPSVLKVIGAYAEVLASSGIGNIDEKFNLKNPTLGSTLDFTFYIPENADGDGPYTSFSRARVDLTVATGDYTNSTGHSVKLTFLYYD